MAGLLTVALVCAVPAQASAQTDSNLAALDKPSENAELPPEIGHWFRDEHGCKVWTTTSVVGKRSNWSGSCVDGYAEGDGAVVWYTYDYGWVGPSTQRRKMFSKSFERKDSGKFVHGKLIGHGTQLWADGMRFEGGFVDGHQTNSGVYSWNRVDVLPAVEERNKRRNEGFGREAGCRPPYPHESVLADEQGVTRLVLTINAKDLLESIQIANPVDSFDLTELR